MHEFHAGLGNFPLSLVTKYFIDNNLVVYLENDMIFICGVCCLVPFILLLLHFALPLLFEEHSLFLVLLFPLYNNHIFCVSEETELQCVPGRFESVEEYIRVFEPLLFEECRAQLYSTWEELTETVSRDLHAMVRIKSIERRERGTTL